MELAAPLLAAPPGRAASPARALLLELTRVHPLLHVGAALLAFTALAAALSGAVLLAMLLAPPQPAAPLPDWLLMGGDEDFLFAISAADFESMMPPPRDAPSAMLPRLGAFTLSVLTLVAAAAQLQSHYERCAVKPCLKRATLLGGLAGVVAIAWSAMLAGDFTPLLDRAELAAILCTAAYSLMVRRCVRIVFRPGLTRRIGSCLCGTPCARSCCRSGSTPPTTARRRWMLLTTRAATRPPAAWRAAPTRSSPRPRCRGK